MDGIGKMIRTSFHRRIQNTIGYVDFRLFELNIHILIFASFL